MTIRPLVILPDTRLRVVSEPVPAITDEIRRLAEDMLETMYDAPGVGLAAIQIGVPKRVITMDVSKSETERQPLVLINPEILWSSEEKRTYEEAASRFRNITRRSSAPTGCASATPTSRARASSRTPTG
jgi:peptide deformylase